MTRASRTLGLLGALFVAAACAPATGAPPIVTPPLDTPTLPARAVYVRASLDARGARPSVEELRALDADPGSLDDKVDALVDDPRFEKRIADLFAPAFRTRIDAYRFNAEQLGFPPEDDGLVQASIAEEPLALVSLIAVNDLPFTDLVRADFTVADDVLATMWPLERLPDDGARMPPSRYKARYTDGRPHAGVLTMNASYWRHTSTIENANRGRTNAWSQALLCQNYLDRPIDFPRDVDLTDSASIHDAIKTNQACLACHSTLDPFASYQWGFMHTADTPDVWSRYHVEQEHDWLRRTGRAPAFFGDPGQGLVDLGRQIAGDERFVSCAVKRIYEGLVGRDARIDDDGALAVHRDAFISGGLRLKALVRSVLQDPGYRGAARRTIYGGRPEPVALKTATPEVLGDALFDLTGYRMTLDRRDALSLDRGLRALAGGSDHGASSSPSTGLVLVQRRLAEAAARAVVIGAVEGRIGALLGELGADFTAPPSPEQLAALAAAVRSVDDTEAAVDTAALALLYDDLAAAGASPDDAWTGVLTALLADPDLLLY